MSKNSVTFRCEPELKDQLVKLAKASGLDISKYIIGILSNAVAAHTILRARTTYEEIHNPVLRVAERGKRYR